MVKDREVETDTHDVIWEDRMEVDEFLEGHVLQEGPPQHELKVQAFKSVDEFLEVLPESPTPLPDDYGNSDDPDDWIIPPGASGG
jgi:hypothetical protein